MNFVAADWLKAIALVAMYYWVTAVTKWAIISYKT